MSKSHRRLPAGSHSTLITSQTTEIIRISTFAGGVGTKLIGKLSKLVQPSKHARGVKQTCGHNSSLQLCICRQMLIVWPMLLPCRGAWIWFYTSLLHGCEDLSIQTTTVDHNNVSRPADYQVSACAASDFLDWCQILTVSAGNSFPTVATRLQK